MDETGKDSEKAVIPQGRKIGILCLKAGMTQVFNKEGEIIPVTVMDLQSNFIAQIKTKNRDGYEAIQVGFLPKKTQHCTRAEKNHFKKTGSPGFYYVKEFRVDSTEGVLVGAVLSPDFLKAGDLVDVTSISKGKGFQGGMKRYNMSGGHKTHGASLSHRSLGSIGNRADPGKCFKNKKMPGQMGQEIVTTQNLRIVTVDNEKNIILVKGSVPGFKNGLVMIRKATKSIK